jgi:hypothetical protein
LAGLRSSRAAHVEGQALQGTSWFWMFELVRGVKWVVLAPSTIKCCFLILIHQFGEENDDEP